jgi:hypothetical protein
MEISEQFVLEFFSQPAKKKKKIGHRRLKCSSQQLIQTPKLWIEEIGPSYLFTHPTCSFGNERGPPSNSCYAKGKVMPVIKHYAMNPCEEVCVQIHILVCTSWRSVVGFTPPPQ